jgi:hypothetical protein
MIQEKGFLNGVPQILYAHPREHVVLCNMEVTWVPITTLTSRSSY